MKNALIYTLRKANNAKKNRFVYHNELRRASNIFNELKLYVIKIFREYKINVTQSTFMTDKRKMTTDATMKFRVFMLWQIH